MILVHYDSKNRSHYFRIDASWKEITDLYRELRRERMLTLKALKTPRSRKITREARQCAEAAVLDFLERKYGIPRNEVKGKVGKDIFLP